MVGFLAVPVKTCMRERDHETIRNGVVIIPGIDEGSTLAQMRSDNVRLHESMQLWCEWQAGRLTVAACS